MAQNKSGVIPLGYWNLGGLSSSKWSGIKNSSHKIVGWDLHSTPGIITVEQKLTKDSGTTVTEFCKARLNCSNGSQYWGSSTSGKIWERTSGGTWRLVHTLTPVVGSAIVLDMEEYQGYIYIATQSRIHRILVTDADDNDWATDCVEDWAEMNLDQTIGGIGATAYSLETSIAETATKIQTFTAGELLLESVRLKIVAKGTGNWTVTVHDASNASMGAVTVTNANLATGLNYFTFSSPLNLLKASVYHVHVTSTVADGTIDTNVATDCEGAQMSFYRTSNSSYHPMFSHPGQQILYIGDNNYVHQVDAGTFTAEALDITQPLIVRSLGQLGSDLLIGTYVADTVTRAEIIRWNGWSVSFTSSDPVQEIGINAFLPADNFVLVQAGNKGNIYYYNGQQLELYGRIPGEYSSTKYGEVYHQSVANKEGAILFGFSNGSGNPVDQGVYRIARADKNYPYVMDLPYVISERSGSDFVTSSISIGGILVAGSDIYVAWKNGSSYGIDKLDASNKLNGAYIESRVMTVNRESYANMSNIVVSYADLPASTDIDIYTDKNYAGYVLLTTVDDVDRNTISTKDEQDNFTTLQVKIKATTSSNSAPKIESVGVFVP